MEFILECRDPYEPNDDDDLLINISTGKAATHDATSFLLNVIDIGAKARDNFIQSVSARPSAFEEPIRRQKVYTFASDAARVKKKSADGTKVIEVRMERDLMGTILAISLENKVDMEYVLAFPLTPVPLCFSHLDGSMVKTKKSILYEILENRIPSCKKLPARVDFQLIDGFFLLRLFVDLPSTFGGVARAILSKICNTTARRIDLVFDRTVSPSIKDSERDRRSDSGRDLPFIISGNRSEP